MLSVVLWILKIIGCIVLVLLVLFALALAAVLFGAVRYQAEGSYREKKLAGTFRITWLFPLVSLSGEYREGLVMTLRILGVPAGKRRKPKSQEGWDDGEETILGTQELGGGTPTGDGEPGEEEPFPEREKAARGEGALDESRSRQEDQSAHTGTAGKTSRSGLDRESGQSAGKDGLLGRAARRLTSFGQNLKKKISQLRDQVRQGWEWKEKIISLWQDEANRRSLRLIRRQMLRIGTHLLPQKGCARVEFGFSDPYTTGEVLKYASLLYPLYAERVDLYPAFDREVMDVEGRLSGRIRLGVLLWHGGRLLLDANIRKYIKIWLNR